MEQLDSFKTFLSTNPGFAVASLCIIAVMWLYRALRTETQAHLETVKQFATEMTMVATQIKDVAELLLHELDKQQSQRRRKDD